MNTATVDYSTLLNDNIGALRPSPTFAVADAAKARKAAGEIVYDFSVGQPAESTPEYVRTALAGIMRDDKQWDAISKYSPVAGIPALKTAIEHKFSDENGLDYKANQILVTNGGKQAIANLMAVTVKKGDEVLMAEPSWVSYADIVKWHGGTPVGMRTNDEFKFTPDTLKLKLALHRKAKWLIINSPSNPTGAVYTKEELQALADIVLEENKTRKSEGRPPLMVMSDDIYEHMVYDDKYLNKPGDSSAISNNIIMANPEMKPYTVVVNGVAKAFGMTGWRVGYAAGPKEIISKMADYQGLETSGVSVISQMAAVAALSREHKTAREAHFDVQRVAYKNRRDLAVGLLNEDGSPFHAVSTPGAFYTMIECTDLAEAAGGCHALADRMIKEKGVALVPGDDFFVEPEKQKKTYMRMSYATDENTIRKGIAAMKDLAREIMPEGPTRTAVSARA